MSVVTISRQFGAAGRTLGEMVAEKLGYVFVDDQIIQSIALEAKVSQTWVETLEREAGSILVKFKTGVGRKSFAERITEKGGYLDEVIYVELLHKIITSVAKKGDLVILGRGGQYILKDREDTYHILMVADKADRIKFIEKRYNLSRMRASFAVNRQEKRRFNLYRKFSKEDYDQPGLYHLVLNMSKLSLEAACAQICCLVNQDQIAYPA